MNTDDRKAFVSELDAIDCEIEASRDWNYRVWLRELRERILKAMRG